MILPTYDRAACLPDAIRSVLGQDFSGAELIVVDDGSRDGTREVVTAFGDRVTYLHQQNRGVSAARNAGIRRARGAWVAFLDSDDVWHRGYLSSQMGAAARFPEAVAHVTDSAMVGADGTRVRHLQSFRLPGAPPAAPEDPVLLRSPLSAVLGHSHWFLQATVVRREIVDLCGGLDERLSIAEDLELLALVATRGPISVRREVLVDVRMRRCGASHLSELSQIDRTKRFEAYAQAYATLLRAATLTRGERALVLAKLGQSYRALGNAWLARGDAALARASYLRAFRTRPSLVSAARYVAAALPYRVAARTVGSERALGGRTSPDFRA